MKRLLTSLFVLLAITAVVFYGMFSTLKSKKPTAPAGAVTAPTGGAQGPR
ncbi:hypothetical protein AAHN93_06635 [Vandammella animalimorsus]|nr:hypothetical protein [Vandammella animalimorsus]